MVFLGSLAGSNTASIDSLTTTGLVTTTALRIGPATAVEETINNVWYGYRGSITVSDTGVTLVTITVPGMVSSDSIYVTPYYSGGATFPSLYARVYDKTAGSFRVALRLDDETPSSGRTCAFYWLIFD
jgi:hypothetical protein